jgi:hypothetical protein
MISNNDNQFKFSCINNQKNGNDYDLSTTYEKSSFYNYNPTGYYNYSPSFLAPSSNHNYSTSPSNYFYDYTSLQKHVNDSVADDSYYSSLCNTSNNPSSFDCSASNQYQMTNYSPYYVSNNYNLGQTNYWLNMNQHSINYNYESTPDMCTENMKTSKFNENITKSPIKENINENIQSTPNHNNYESKKTKQSRNILTEIGNSLFPFFAH